MQIDASSLKKKDYIQFNNDIWQVNFVEFYHPGKGRTVVRTRLRSVNSGKGQAQVFTSNQTLEVVEVVAAPVQFLYSGGDFLTFMHEQTFEQYEVPAHVIGEVAGLLKEGQSMFILFHEETPIGIRPPKRVELIVTEADDAIKGDTATNAKKQVTVETGAKIMVPLFIKKGEKIAINPETMDYVERA